MTAKMYKLTDTFVLILLICLYRVHRPVIFAVAQFSCQHSLLSADVDVCLHRPIYVYA